MCYCSFILMHCSWNMNSAKGTGLKKKKKETLTLDAHQCYPNTALISSFLVLIFLDLDK